MIRIYLALLLIVIPASGLSAQGLVALKKETQRFADPTENVADLVVEIRDNLWKEVLLVPDPNDKHQEIARLLAFSRGDLQTGATSGSSGTTSAVISPLLPAIFGMSLEMARSHERSRAPRSRSWPTPPGWCAPRRQAPPAPSRFVDREACRTLWTRLGVTASFDSARGEKKAELANLETLGSQFSALAVRYEILNRRDVTLDRVNSVAEPFFKRADALMKGQQELSKALDGATTRVEKELNTLVTSAPWTGSTGEVRKKMVEEVVRKVVAGTTLSAADAAQARTLWRETLEAYDQLLDRIAGAAVVTLDFSLQQPDLTTTALAGGIVPKGVRPPALYTARVVFAKAVLPDLDVTSNVSVSLFHEKRQGMPNHFRDVRVGLEGKFKLRSLAGYGRPVLAFAGLYTLLNQEPLGLGITFNGADIKTRGHIGVFQAKLEFPTANNSMRIPLSLTVSNRTELIKESEVRGQIGVSFNLDSLFASVK